MKKPVNSQHYSKEEIMNKNIVYAFVSIAFMLLLLGCGSNFSEGGVFADAKDLVAEAKAGITQIYYKDFKAKLDSLEADENDESRIILIDVREPAEFENGYINQPNEDEEYPYSKVFTVNIPRGLIEFKITDSKYWDNDLWVEMPNKDEQIFLYSQRGKRSALAALTLQQLGYSNVLSFKDGFRKWLDPTAPEEKEEKRSSGG